MSDRVTRATCVAVLGLLASLGAAVPAGAQASNTPPINLLYQNFPNPFPSSTSPVTCVWFDLAQNSSGVTLAIYDLRGRLVRTLVPSSTVSSTLPGGYYGRAGSGPTATGCDPRLSWDGRGSDGRVVPSGVYLVRLHVDDAWQTKKIIFRGP